MIGISPGNGHPYSFSAIFNGYDDQEMVKCPYPGIYSYLRKRSPDEFGIPNAKVTCVWTPDRRDAEKIAKASQIPNVVDNLSELPDLVDAAIIARDDADSHWPIAQLFLTRGIPVFVDKPLAKRASDLRLFEPFLRHGSLMSCSAMRYAVECDEAKSSIAELGEIRAVHAICAEGDWFKYGAHIVEGYYGLLGPGAVSVRHVGTSKCHIVRVRFSAGLMTVFQVTEGIAPLFQLQLFGAKGRATVVINDVFTMFRRALSEFVRMIQTGIPPIPPDETVEITKLLISADMSLAEKGTEVFVSEVC